MMKPIFKWNPFITRSLTLVNSMLIIFVAFMNSSHAQIDFVVNSAVFSPSTINVGNTSLLTTHISINSTLTGAPASLNIGCLEIVISLPSTKKYVPPGGVASVSPSGLGSSFNWIYVSNENALYGLNNVILNSGTNGNISVLVEGLAVTSVPATTTVNVSELLQGCTSSNNGNNDSQTANLTVEGCAVDTIAPNLVCNAPLDLNLSYGDNYLIPDSLISATDNCPGAMVIKGRRMETICAANANLWQDTIRFCCADVNLTRQVMVRVTDMAGNSSTCMVQVSVKDKLNPVIEELLPDITISCDYDIDLNDLEAFGTYVFHPSDRSEIEINDPLFAGPKYDGWVTDNCPNSLILTELPPFDQRGPHNNGNIVRRFEVKDGANNVMLLSQTITIMDADPLDLSDITWPPDASYTDCTAIPPDTSLTGSPVIDYDDICTIPAASYKDQIFDDPTSGCVYIRRTWKVIDWAQYIPNTTTGLWQHIQHIHLINSVPPVITPPSCSDSTICAVNAECDALVKLRARATDDCTKTSDLYFEYKIDVSNNGSVDYLGAIDSFAIRMPRGTHKISWRVEDRCGNITDCSYLITVKECKAPTPICMYGLSTNLEDNGAGGTAVIWAKDFNNHSYDNCTSAAELKYSFSSDVNHTSMTLDCEDVDSVNLGMWVTDKDGNQSYCNTFIKVTDNKHLCPDSINGNIPGILVSGRIATEENALLKGVNVTLKDAFAAMTDDTDDNGKFSIENITPYGTYQLKPEKNNDWAAGISTIDLVMIQRHILNVAKLNSPYKIIAADANNDQKISASDLVALRKIILGLEKEIQGNTSWRFIPSNKIFADPLKPWPFVEYVDLIDINTSIYSSNFTAVKTGDVNGTAGNVTRNDIASGRSLKYSDLLIKDEYFESGRFINVPVTLDHSGKLVALQTGFKLDNSMLEFSGIINEQIDLTKDAYRYDLNTGRLYISHYENNALELKEGSVLFILQFKAVGSGKLSKALQLTDTSYENYLVDENIQPVYLNIRLTDEMEALKVQQNAPNPFTDYTDVKIFIADEGKIEITIFDNAGIKIYNQIRQCPAGVNQLRIDREQLGDKRGVFYLHIATGERKEIKKLLRLY